MTTHRMHAFPTSRTYNECVNIQQWYIFLTDGTYIGMINYLRWRWCRWCSSFFMIRQFCIRNRTDIVFVLLLFLVVVVLHNLLDRIGLHGSEIREEIDRPSFLINFTTKKSQSQKIRKNMFENKCLQVACTNIIDRKMKKGVLYTHQKPLYDRTVQKD